MAIIVPAILEETKDGFLAKVSDVVKLPGVERVQVDFGDGDFVAHRTLDIGEVDTLNPAFEWEAHLMVRAPADFLDYEICGFSTIILHYEAYESVAALQNALAEIKRLGLKCGIAINPETDIRVLEAFSGAADQFTLLSVEPGFQGGEFQPQTIERIRALRELIPNAIIEVDGGISEHNIGRLAEAGADFLVVGSALVKSPNMAEAREHLERAMAGNGAAGSA